MLQVSIDKGKKPLNFCEYLIRVLETEIQGGEDFYHDRALDCFLKLACDQDK